MIELTLKTEDQKIWFTSDTHFGHENIIKFCSRPWADVEKMDANIIKNWNSCVGENDIIFHLGDFAVGNGKFWESCLDQLNGNIYLISGNHDRKTVKNHRFARFRAIGEEGVITVDGQRVWLNHFPFLCYAGSWHSDWQLFGHVHTNPGPGKGLDDDRLQYLLPGQYDVGVDNNNYFPISYEEVKAKIDENKRQKISK